MSSPDRFRAEQGRILLLLLLFMEAQLFNQTGPKSHSSGGQLYQLPLQSNSLLNTWPQQYIWASVYSSRRPKKDCTYIPARPLPFCKYAV